MSNICRYQEKCINPHCTRIHYTNPSNGSKPTYPKPNEGNSLINLKSNILKPTSPKPHEHKPMDPKANGHKPKSNVHKSKAQKFNLDDKLNPLIGTITYGNEINYLSLRVYSEVSFMIKNGKFHPNFKKDNAKATLLYKENNKKKPISFCFYWNEDSEKKVSIILEKMSHTVYHHIDRSTKPYGLFYKGHISQCFTTLDEMYNSCFEAGNMKLEKKNYDDPQEEYKLNSIINKTAFKGIYLWNHTIVELKSLHKDKNPTTESDCICVICLEGEAEYAVIPCGHQCLCSDSPCRALTTCPICRGNVGDIIKIS